MTAVFALKFVLIGDSGVGKTHLLRKFMNKSVETSLSSTNCMEFSIRDIPFERCFIKAQIWDTSGNKRPDGMNEVYYQDAVGAILVFDMNNEQSFENVKNIWLIQMREFGHQNMSVILVGNKLDIASNSKMSHGYVTTLAKAFNMDYIETSAKTNHNVQTAFRRIILSVASNLAVVKTHLEISALPTGWIVANNKSLDQDIMYENYWTGRPTRIKPTDLAETNLIYDSQSVKTKNLFLLTDKYPLSNHPHQNNGADHDLLLSNTKQNDNKINKMNARRNSQNTPMSHSPVAATQCEKYCILS